jgi:hypothetical protein
MLATSELRWSEHEKGIGILDGARGGNQAGRDIGERVCEAARSRRDALVLLATQVEGSGSTC